jgi:hypothetical protein
MEPIEALQKDYESTLGFIDKCDEHMFKIKNWALITTSAIIAFSISKDEDSIVLVNLVLILAFMYLELIYKSFQDTAIEHTTDLSMRIDKHLKNIGQSDLLKDYEFGFGRKLQYPSFHQVGKVVVNKYRRHIVNFYGLIALFSVGAFLVGRYVV